MQKVIVFLTALLLSGCVAGEFSPERHAQYEEGHPDCKVTPERCINGVPW